MVGTDEGMTDGEEGGRYVHIVLIVSSLCGLVVMPSFRVRASLLHVVVAYIVCRIVVMVVVVSLWCCVVIVWWYGGVVVVFME